MSNYIYKWHYKRYCLIKEVCTYDEKSKKAIVFAMMMVMLVCSCMPVAAATDGVNDCGYFVASTNITEDIHIK